MAVNLGLRGLIYSKYQNEAKMADAIGWNRQRLNKITHGDRIPSLNDVNVLSEALGVSFMDVAAFFLPEKSTNVDN